MKASNFTDAQHAFIIKQAEDGTSVAEVRRKAGISSAGFFNCQKKHAGLMPSEMKRLRECTAEEDRRGPRARHIALDKGMLLDIVKRKL